MKIKILHNKKLFTYAVLFTPIMKRIVFTTAIFAATILFFSCTKMNDKVSGVKNFKSAVAATSTNASWYLSTADGVSKFAAQTPIAWQTSTAPSGNQISLNAGTTYQDVHGFGFTFTEGSAEVLSTLSSITQNNLLNDLFNTSSGLGISVLRISIGASDLSSSVYTYNDVSAPTSGVPIGSVISLKAASCNLFVSINDGVSAITANKTTAGATEQFTVVDAGKGLIALKGSNGKYVTGSSPMYCNATSIGSLQKFTWGGTNGQVNFKCSGNKKFISSENCTGAMNCNRTSASGWETFNWQSTNATDPTLSKFSLSGPDSVYLIPMLKKVLAINPNIKILATPWSAPIWMKNNTSWYGGSLLTEYYTSYANYFVKYINAMKANGITIWAITPQNEPENPNNQPSMLMSSAEQTSFINNNLGPAFTNAGITTKIIAFDHNCDNTNYPTNVLNNSSYVDGAAFHLYAGNISAMSTVKNATGKNVYFTEQYVGSGSSFGGTMKWHLENVMLGSMNNWAKIALEWNLATNTSYGPRTPTGCSTCEGAITVSGATSFTKNVSYYIVAHMSKFIVPGSLRIQTISNAAGITNTAFSNGANRVLVLLNNNSSAQNITVVDSGRWIRLTLPAGAVTTVSWN